jgi:hypothetical protein
MSLFDDLPHRITIHGPPVIVTDAAKGKYPTWPTVRASGVPCLILQGTGSERDEFSQDQRQVATHSIAFSGCDGGIETGDKIVNDTTGKTYWFTGTRPQQGVGNIDGFNVISVRELIE